MAWSLLALLALFDVVLSVLVFARVMRLVSESTVGLSAMMAKFMALVLIDVLLTVALLIEVVDSTACADIDSSSVLVMSFIILNLISLIHITPTSNGERSESSPRPFVGDVGWPGYEH